MINVAGVVSIVLFYLLILGVGIWAGRKKEAGNDSEEEVMLAGRSIGLFVGIFTMTGIRSERCLTYEGFNSFSKIYMFLQQPGLAEDTLTELLR